MGDLGEYYSDTCEWKGHGIRMSSKRDLQSTDRPIPLQVHTRVERLLVKSRCTTPSACVYACPSAAFCLVRA